VKGGPKTGWSQGEFADNSNIIHKTCFDAFYRIWLWLITRCINTLKRPERDLGWDLYWDLHVVSIRSRPQRRPSRIPVVFCRFLFCAISCFLSTCEFHAVVAAWNCASVSVNMQNEEGENVDLYIPRKWWVLFEEGCVSPRSLVLIRS
jgi:hypothetical protein